MIQSKIWRYRPRQVFHRPLGIRKVPAPILVACLDWDPLASKSLAQIASSLPQTDVLHNRLLRAGRSAQIVIVDCRICEPTRHKDGRAKLSPEAVKGLRFWKRASIHRRFSPTDTPITCCGRCRSRSSGQTYRLHRSACAVFNPAILLSRSARSRTHSVCWRSGLQQIWTSAWPAACREHGSDPA